MVARCVGRGKMVLLRLQLTQYRQLASVPGSVGDRILHLARRQRELSFDSMNLCKVVMRRSAPRITFRDMKKLRFGLCFTACPNQSSAQLHRRLVSKRDGRAPEEIATIRSVVLVKTDKRAKRTACIRGLVRL